MKKIGILSLLLGFAVYTSAQEYVMWETMYIYPKMDKLDEFHEAFAAHNKKYHAEGASGNIIRFVSYGEHAGAYVWGMGPLTFSDLDTRPADKSHDDDWNDVLPYVESISKVELWRQEAELSYEPEGYEGSDKIHIRIWDLEPGSWEEFEEILKKVAKVFHTQADDNSWHIYWNVLASGDGRDVAAVYGFEKWAEWDEDSNWAKDYNAVHGEGEWYKTMQKMMKISTMKEEVRELVPELGGKTQ